MREREKAAQKSQLALAIERNLDPAIGTAKHCAQTQQQDWVRLFCDDLAVG